MDYTKLLLSGLAVFVVSMVSGVIVSIISTTLQCSKLGFTTALYESGKWSIAPTVVYLLAAAFLLVRTSFVGTFRSFGVPEETARILGVGYLVMLISWVTSVSIIHNSETTVCQTDIATMTDFKKKMLAELAQKEKAKEDNAKK